jgi:hypothetical protein
MIEREELPKDAVILQAALLGEIGDPSRGAQLIRDYLEEVPNTPWRDLAEQILEHDLGAERTP